MSGHGDIAALIATSRYRDAVAAATTRLATDPEDADLLGLLVQAHLGLKDHAAALAGANRLVAARPDQEWGHRLASIALDGLKRPDEALRAAHEAVRLAPYSWQTHLQLAVAAVDARGQLMLAQQAADQALRMAPNEPDVQFIVGLVAQRRQWDDVARAAYERTLALDPEHAAALNNLTVLGGHRNLGGAARGYAEALRHDPQSGLAQDNVLALAASFTRRIYYSGLVAFLIGLAASVTSGGTSPLTVAIGLILAVGVCAYVVRLSREVPRGVRAFVVAKMRSEAYLTASTVLAIIMVVTALIVCLVPGGDTFGLAALRPIGLANVALVVWSATRSQ